MTHSSVVIQFIIRCYKQHKTQKTKDSYVAQRKNYYYYSNKLYLNNHAV